MSSTQVFAKAPAVWLVSTKREHTEVMVAWDKALRAKAPDTPIWGMGDFAAVPFFIPKALIRNGLADELPQTPVLCDWDGSMYDALQLEPDDLLQVRVVDADGRSLTELKGGPDDAKLAAVLAALGS